jgi:hypothetical protein
MLRFFFTGIPFLLGTSLWLADGARFRFWATSVEIREEVPIIEGMPELGTQTKVSWREELIFGLETPILGFSLSVFFFLFAIYTKRSLKNPPT